MAFKNVFFLIGLAFSGFVAGFIHSYTWTRQAQRQALKLQLDLFKSILGQEIAYHDMESANQLKTMLMSNVAIIKDGIGSNLSLIFQHIVRSIVGLTIALVYTWKIGLVVLSIAPAIGVSTVLLNKVTFVYAKKERQAYAKAGSISKEILSSIKTVTAFGCQKKEMKRYSKNLNSVRPIEIKRGFLFGCFVGTINSLTILVWGVVYWFGSRLVIAQEIRLSDFVTSFSGVMLASAAIGQAISIFQHTIDAKVAAFKVFQCIDRKPDIDIFSEDGAEPNPKSGDIVFDHVNFEYPTRPGATALKEVSFNVKCGQRVAIIGESGAGKSTIVQLIQRFYNSSSGEITIGGQDIRKLHLRKYRDTIGVVSQEPVLFATTIAENIRWGREGITDEEVVEASKQANAYNFIMKFPKKFNTLVGEGGGQLSGGQKQRIAIARAIARNPKILLLDEATSALDRESESLVQAALEKAATGRTTIIVAHRLSTIRGADNIIAMRRGQVVEVGSHDELMKNKNGVYFSLYSAQSKVDQESDAAKDDVIDRHRHKSVTAVGIALAHSWQLTLANIAFVPLEMVFKIIFRKVNSQIEVKGKLHRETAATTALESISNIRTVASLTKEYKILELYGDELHKNDKSEIRKAVVKALIYAFHRCSLIFAIALTNALGVFMIARGQVYFRDMFVVVATVLHGGTALSRNGYLLPNYAEAKISTRRIFALLDRISRIDSYSEKGASPDSCKGAISFKDVKFSYPTRPDCPVLKNVDIVVKPGQTLALVGQSGSGKSTTVQLIERFYDPQNGKITLDDVDVKELNVAWLREQIGLVSQEPDLFDQTIQENIRYGEGSKTSATSDVVDAAMNANIHDFVSDLPQGYDTIVGEKGGKLSGGQKQRIAIARALLRNPKILLLDEATSALDTESEKVVQEALDVARRGRTSIIIAHRLSTIINADQIAVIDDGAVVEIGTHDELLDLKGVYFNLTMGSHSSIEDASQKN